MSDMTNTQFFRVADEQHIEVSDILNTVCKALTEKGYNPINQIVGISCRAILHTLPAIIMPEALL